jgi:alkylation response protein AidB-like acyl-CoA dehydrogenase
MQRGLYGKDHEAFRECVVMEELAKVCATSLSSGFGLQDDIAIPYIADLGTEEQQARWLPPMASGEAIGAIAMTEPGAGSDLQGIRTTAVRDHDAASAGSVMLRPTSARHPAAAARPTR